MAQKILLIQDDAADINDVREALINSADKRFEVEWVRDCAAGLRRLAEDENPEGRTGHGIAAVLLDLAAPGSLGIVTFDQFLLAAPQIPFLVLCTEADEDLARLAVQHGAQDYLLKARLDNYLLPKTVRSMIERAANAEALFDEKERAEVTLNSIGDAVMSTDIHCAVTYLNTVAEGLTGWSREEALGRPLANVFRIIDAKTREPVVNPMELAIRENRTVGLTPNCILVRRDGVEAAIEDSAAPIHNRRGQVTGAVMVFHDVTSARAMSLRMSHLAQHDGLTDLPNRILLNDRLTQAIALARRHHGKLAVLFIDLDRFKHVNDSLGHAMGDRLLQAVAARLLSCVRSSDTVSRQGGDEFVILLSEVTHGGDAAFIAEKILRVLREPNRLDDHDLHLTGSIGIVTYPDDGCEGEVLLKNADFAMYQVKNNGRDNYQFFKPDMNERAIARLSLENDLRHALQRGEFLLHYQPKVDLQTNAISGVEALIRWRHPQRGLVSPVDFIPVAEECGFIVPIGRWVLREACRQAHAWQLAGVEPIRVAVNVSAVELRVHGFVDSVSAILREAELEPACLELELTETFLMQDSTSTAVVLGGIRNLGVRIALDDFGTGFSSLSYLRRFPIDTLKIDRSFVHDLTTDGENASIVSAVVAMGRSLSMQVVAEGVETREQFAFLREHNCPQGQGYYFSYPMVAGEFSQLVGTKRGRASNPQPSQ